MTEKYIMVNLEDEKSRKLGEAISNPNCKKVINLLTEKELTASEISQKLKIPLNALNYNLKKLIDSGIIEKSKHFWSVKGKKIPTYKVVNKVIVIQPKKTSNSSVYSKLRGFIPVIFILALLTLVIALNADKINLESYSGANVNEKSLQNCEPISGSGENTTQFCTQNSDLLVQEDKKVKLGNWVWFAVGALIAVVLFIVFNWKKIYYE